MTCPMIVDLFAGPGGWEEGARLACVTDPIVGIEHDESACATRAAAGHASIRADVATYPVGPFARRVRGLIASPPCQAFSSAGKRDGIADVGRIVAHAHGCLTGWHDYTPDGWADVRSPLVLEVLRYALQLVPEWVACEQVPEVLPLWETFARVLNAHGWLTWCGILNAADYGVPQTRRRAILLASRVAQPTPPPATHAKDPAPVLFGDEMLPWVSMSDALGWHDFRMGFPRLDDRGDSEDGYRERDWRDANEPAFTLTEKARSWVVQTGNNSHVTSRDGSKAGEGGVELYERPVTEPAPTLDTMSGAKWRIVGVNTGRDWKAGGTRDDAQFVPATAPAPAPAIDGKGRWHAILASGEIPTGLADASGAELGTTAVGTTELDEPAPKGLGDVAEERHALDDDSRPTEVKCDSVRLTIVDALVLQSFRPDHPVQGTKTKQFEQVGNAIPPVLAAAALRAVGAHLKQVNHPATVPDASAVCGEAPVTPQEKP